ncbi:MAG: sodium:alanine symporter family protein, partial [Ruminococcus sp.]|nr:sodium:alanine symporter family protein [Ruminococcus sp.]
MNDLIKTVDEWLWGLPLICLILGCGVFLTIRLRGVQFRRLGLALKYMVKNEEAGEGDVTSFGALCTALSATIGTGNIVGVATAIAMGGPGALFWMELAALLGMATKYSEGLLAIRFRTRDSAGNVLGGPFYYIENGMGKRWKWIAKLFAFFGTLVGLFGIGTFTQISGITSAADSFFSTDSTRKVTLFGNEYTIVTVIVGLIVTACAALVIIGGIQSISKVSELVVPFMAAAYVLCVVVIIVTHLTEIPGAIAEIFAGAFGLRPVAGATVGGTIMMAAQMGIARGIFSNEAGLGSAPIAAAAARTESAARQG